MKRSLHEQPGHAGVGSRPSVAASARPCVLTPALTFARFCLAQLCLLICLQLALPSARAQAREQAREIDLHPALCISAAPGEIAQLAHGAYRVRACPEEPRTDGWVWFRLRAPELLADLPANWVFVVDNSRFERIVMRAQDRDGHEQLISHSGTALGRDWEAGGLLRFVIPTPGRDIAALAIGYQGLDGPRFVRKFAARGPQDDAFRHALWLLLVGVMAGTLLCASIYNAALFSELRFAFQIWYVTWAISALGYGLCWTNTLGLISDRLVGPFANRAGDVTLGLMIASGVLFLRTLLEPQAQTPAAILVARVIAIAAVVFGVLSAWDEVIPPLAADLAFNLIILASTGWVLATALIALTRNSRVVWFYLVGWAPVIVVLGLRLARNDGVLPQSDLVDMAVFLALTFEAMALSFTTGHRLRALRRERDEAESTSRVMAAEAETLRRVAYVDALTGLANRPAYMRALENLSDDAVLFVVDVDHLKKINDTFGHRHGDALLLHLARRLRQCAPHATIVARRAGSEFAILAPTAQAAAIAERLDGLQGEPWTSAERTLSISLSIGEAQIGGHPPDPQLLREQADHALKESRLHGRGKRTRYSEALAGRYTRDAGFMAEIAGALANRELDLYYQPIVDLRDGRVLAEEALLRWHHPRLGTLTPGTFGALLDDESWGPIIQDHVLSLALDRLVRTRDVPGYMTVNFTGTQLRGASSARHILGRLELLGIPAHRLCVEVTERVTLDDAVSQVTDALRLLHAAGVRVALDDFGTGYASLRHLRLFPIDIIKIDRSFVSSASENDSDADKIVRSIVSLGQSLDKVVIAEGVETEAQRRHLVALGCRTGQGYLFSMPLPEHALPPRGRPMLPDPRVASVTP